MTLANVSFIKVDGIDIAYCFDGPEDGKVVVLVTGFGDQLTDWPMSLVHGLTGKDYRVLRFEPRDSGLSGAKGDWQTHDMQSLVAAAMGAGPNPDYTLDDLADELLGLLDALGINDPHVIGYSMGGLISQRAALKIRFDSLTLLFTSSQAPGLSIGDMAASQASLMLTQPIEDEIARIAAGVQLVIVTNGPIHRKSEEEACVDIAAQQARAYKPAGIGRMMLALLKSPAVYDRLNMISTPCLILSAEKDCFFAADHSADLALRLPNSVHETIAGSGHNLPETLGREIADRWLTHFRKNV